MCNRYSWNWFLYLSRFVCYINCLSYCLLRCLLNYYFLDACCTGCCTTFLAWLAFLTGDLTALVCFTLFLRAQVKSRHQEKLKVLHQDCMNIIDSTLSDALMQSYIMNRQQLLYKLSVIAFVLEHLIHNYVEQVFYLCAMLLCMCCII